MKYEIKKTNIDNQIHKDYYGIRVSKVNELNKYINRVMPKILNVLNDNLKLKKDGEINKKCKDLIYNDILKNKPSNIQVWFECSKHSGWIKFKTSFTSDLWSSNYIEENIYLWSNKTDFVNGDFKISETEMIKEFKYKKIKCLESVLNVIKKSNSLKDKIEELNNKINKLESGYNNFLNK